MDLTLVVLAAGVGHRYGGLKQLEPVGPQGETLLEYSVHDALQAGFTRVVLVVRSETEGQFRSAFANGMANRISLTYVHQNVADLPPDSKLPRDRVRPWGTGQAILAAEPVIEDRFAVVNADDFYGAESFVTVASFLLESGNGRVPTFAMLGFRVSQTLTKAGPASRALCQLDEHGRLQRIVEILELWKRGEGGAYLDEEGQEVMVGPEELVSMNMWGFTRDLFPELKVRFERFLAHHGLEGDAEFLIPDVVQSLVDEDRIRVDVLGPAGPWCGMTYPEDRERSAVMIASLVAAGRYPKQLWA